MTIVLTSSCQHRINGRFKSYSFLAKTSLPPDSAQEKAVRADEPIISVGAASRNPACHLGVYSRQHIRGDCILKLDQLIPFEKIHMVLKRFCTSTGMGCTIVDPEGQVVCAADWQRFCDNCPSATAPALGRCFENGNALPEKLIYTAKPIISTCSKGLSIAVATIMVEGVNLASIIARGQFPATSSAGESPITISEPECLITASSPKTASVPVYSKGGTQLILSHLELFAELLSEMARNALEKEDVHGQLIESEKRYQCLVNTLPQIVFEVDLQGRLTFANQSAYEIFGYTHQEITNGFDLNFFLPPYEHEKVTMRLKRLLSGEVLDPEEYYFLRKDGSLFPALVFSRSFSSGNEVRGVRGVIVDITLRKLVKTN